MKSLQAEENRLRYNEKWVVIVVAIRKVRLQTKCEGVATFVHSKVKGKMVSLV